jgi:Sec-independent protein secretion pathway component TatC
LACGAIAARLPGDAITLLLEGVPLYLLFELSLLLATLFLRRANRRDPAADTRGPREHCARSE